MCKLLSRTLLKPLNKVILVTNVQMFLYVFGFTLLESQPVEDRTPSGVSVQSIKFCLIFQKAKVSHHVQYL